MMLAFGKPEYLPAIFAGFFLLIFAGFWVTARMRNRRRMFSDPEAMRKCGNPTGSSRIFFRFFVLALIPLLFALILIEPIARETFKEPVYEEIEIVIVSDGSKSTLITDIYPGKSRLDFVRDDIVSVIKSMNGENAQDRFGLVLFADSAVPLVPIPTNDYERSLMPVIEALDCHYIVNALVQGTDIGEGLATGISLFTPESRTKLLILIGDGENQGDADELQKNYQAALKAYAETKRRLEVENARKGLSGERALAFKLLVIGIGDETKSSKVPRELDERCRAKSFETHIEGPHIGKEIFSRPNFTFLKDKIAVPLKGEFRTAKHSGEAAKIIRSALAKSRPLKEYKIRDKEIDISNRFFAAIFVLLLILLFL